MIQMTLNLNQLDLNLLRVFAALYAERSVTRAGRRLGLSQSATSNALARLREAFGDELFLRAARGVEPTALAQALHGPIGAALERVEAALALNLPFDPATTRAEFAIGMSDYAEFLIAPPLVRHLRQTAPLAGLTLRHVDRTTFAALLDDDAVSLAVGVLPEPPPRMTQVFLTREDFVVLMDDSHPAARRPLELETYLAFPHLLVSAAGSREGAVDRVLRGMGRERRLLVVVSHYLVAAPMLKGSDLLCTMPRQLGASLGARFGLAVAAAPVELAPVRLSMVFHRRYERQPAHAWLRQAVRGVLPTP